MTITRVKTAGWATNEKLSSAQQNAMDINVTNALDKRLSQTDTLASNVTVAGSGAKINWNTGTQANFNTGSSLNVNTGSIINISSGTFDVKTGGVFLTDTGSVSTFNGIVTFNDPITITDTVALTSTSVLNQNAGNTINLNGIVSFNDPTLSGNVNGALTLNNSFILTVRPTASISLAGVLIATGTILADDFQLSGSNKVKFNSPRTFTRAVQTTPFSPSSGYNIDTLGFGYIQTVGTNPFDIMWELSLPNGAILHTATIAIKPNPAHTGFSLILPIFTLVIRNVADGTGPTSFARSDPSGTLTAYQLNHTIQVAPIGGITVDNTLNRYTLVFSSEGGADALADCQINGITINYTVSNMDDSK